MQLSTYYVNTETTMTTVNNNVDLKKDHLLTCNLHVRVIKLHCLKLRQPGYFVL